MFKRKNVLISLAVALLISACGGGGGDDPAPAASTPPPAAGNPGGGDQPPPVIDESVMAGNLQLVDPAVIFNITPTDAGIPINVAQFEPNATLPDGAGSFARGTDAPIKSFGLRVTPEDMAPGGVGQAKRVRMAIDLTEEAATVAAGEEAEILQFMVDQVDLAVSDAGELSVSVPATAQLFVYTKNSAGGTANQTVTALPADAVRFIGVDGDQALTIDFDALFASLLASAQGDTAKLAVFNSVKDFVGTFGMGATVSNVVIQKAADAVATGSSITVTGSSQPAVTGAGLQGRLKLE